MLTNELGRGGRLDLVDAVMLKRTINIYPACLAEWLGGLIAQFLRKSAQKALIVNTHGF